MTYTTMRPAHRTSMMMTRLFSLALLVSSATACNDFLDEQPPDRLPVDEAINDAVSARAALVGAYNALQNSSYYGGDYEIWGDLSSDNAEDIGTFNSWKDAARHQLRADNGTVSDIWEAIYDGINRANVILEAVPAVADLSTTEKNQILGEAYTLRALGYHNLVKFFGGVPIRLAPIKSVPEAGDAVRATSAEVYTQILSDLQQGELLQTDTTHTTTISLGAAKALLARVYLYQQDWVNANAKADEVIGMGYDLSADYTTLFDAEGITTPEDIFKVTFTAQQYQYMYYWISDAFGGGGEVAPTPDLAAAYNQARDLRFPWNIYISGSIISGYKYPTTAGAEDIHVIRFAEVLLIKAEALARQNQLAPAVTEYNKIRVRANLAPHVLGVDVTTQQEVLDEIDLQRRLELCMEGDRWPDLVRTGRVATVFPTVPATQYLYPIPQSEIDVAPGLAQNPGY